MPSITSPLYPILLIQILVFINATTTHRITTPTFIFPKEAHNRIPSELSSPRRQRRRRHTFLSQTSSSSSEDSYRSSSLIQRENEENDDEDDDGCVPNGSKLCFDPTTFQNPIDPREEENLINNLEMEDADNHHHHLSLTTIEEDEEVCIVYDVPSIPSYELPSSTNTTTTRGIIIVDNFSPYHGNYIATMAQKGYNAGVVSVLSEYITGYLYQEKNLVDHLSMRAPEPSREEEWASRIPFEIVGIVCESDSGLETAERLGVALGLYPDRHDGVNPARRDKYLMNEECSQHGLNVVKQKLCETVEEALDFAAELGVIDDVVNGYTPNSDDELTEIEPTATEPTKKCILKPRRGVASDSVFLCQSLHDIQTAFTQIYNTTVFGALNGQRHSTVLIQEYAIGTEYAVDVVSKAGIHKVAALWKYDKGPANDAQFVYVGTELVDADTEEGRLACEYAMAALDALGIHWGMSHSEIMVNGKDDTKLIEVNCRQHNTDFAPLAQACVGYNALDMILSAYLGDGDDFVDGTERWRLHWDNLPELPNTRAYGAIVHLVCFVEGKVVKLRGVEEIQELESVLKMEIYPQFLEGNVVHKTVDIRTDAGWVHLIHEEEEVFRKDYEKIVQLMPGMFVVEEEEDEEEYDEVEEEEDEVEDEDEIKEEEDVVVVVGGEEQKDNT